MDLIKVNVVYQKDCTKDPQTILNGCYHAYITSSDGTWEGLTPNSNVSPRTYQSTWDILFDVADNLACFGRKAEGLRLISDAEELKSKGLIPQEMKVLNVLNLVQLIPLTYISSAQHQRELDLAVEKGFCALEKRF